MKERERERQRQRDNEKNNVRIIKWGLRLKSKEDHREIGWEERTMTNVIIGCRHLRD